MNYRHGFHAGNFVDCAKHALLVGLLRALARKDAGFACIETHAGAGVYDLTGAAARATSEADAGIQRVWTATGARPPMIAAWLAEVAAVNGTTPGSLQAYPGSPALLAAGTRPQDRVVCCELLESEAESLRSTLGHRLRVEVGDGYARLKALVPPPERRGLVFIDPPYESPTEFRTAADALADGLKRWPTGVFAVWYPIKDAAEVAGFQRRVVAAGLTKVLRAEFRRVPEGRAPGLIGSGLLVVNPPFGFAPEAEDALRWLGSALAAPEPVVRVDWLVPER
jgi:23S rRNA (adenine2030-N6)-methyltransferase